MSDYPLLFSPIQIGSLTFRNRMECAPTSLEDFTRRGYVPDGFYDYFEQRAAGGAALVTIGETPVESKSGKTQHDMLEIDDPNCVPDLARMADRIHRHGALASLELSHAGAAVESLEPGYAGMGPSAIKNPFTGEWMREMTEDDIEFVTEAFGTAALRLKTAGFDMCMVHAGHGWLLGQFLSPLTNRRTDRFGGSVANRLRFTEMVIERIRQKCGRAFPIELRISGSEYSVKGGYNLPGGVELCEALDGQVDLFHISCCSVFEGGGSTIVSPSPYEPRGRNVHLAAEIKKHVKTPVATIGSIVDPEMMEQILESGQADIIAAARTFVADPYFPRKAKNGEAARIRPCLRCIGCLDDTMCPPQVIRCAVNPTIGREAQYCHLPPAGERLNILVAGGGPAGMQAAITARERGHSVTLCEKTGELGGAIRYGRGVPFKDDTERYRLWLINELRLSGADVRLNTPVDAALVRELNPDYVICAVGAESVVPPIPGIDGANVIAATRLHDEGVTIGQRVAIIGGGLVGCEAAIWLKMTGREPVIIEMAPDILPGVEGHLDEYTRIALEKNSVPAHTGMRVTSISKNGVYSCDGHGNETLFEADTVVISVGMRPLADVREDIRSASRSFRPVGDCDRVGRIKNATASGYAAAVYPY